jgi:uncharacterized protein YcaQ
MALSVSDLRHRAIGHTLFAPTTLLKAIGRLGFVQADPIRAPARAQDLILRPRVRGYRAGDLERRYPGLEIEEDLLYAYGFLPRAVSQWLHPRAADPLDDLEREVLAVIADRGPMHPGDVAAQFGAGRVVNAWGSYSKATKAALERLHYRGLLRVARRDNGIRVYQVAAPRPDDLSPEERLRRLLLVCANVLAPVPERTLQAIGAVLRRRIAGVPDHREARRVLAGLVTGGELERQRVDGLVYLWPVPGPVTKAPPGRVRFLAPFDPLVWDRLRFEHLWGWAYRFEAYTPAAKRVRGYYALPVLWRDQVIGWANAGLAGGALRVDVGFVGPAPSEAGFAAEAAAEAELLARFLGLEKASLALADSPQI